jgi:hypothetical protein
VTDGAILQVVLTSAGIVATAVVALLNVKQNQTDKAAEKRLEGIGFQMGGLHDEVRAVRSDLRVMDSDVRRHAELLGGTTTTLDAMKERQKQLEDEVKQIIREGCAHRARCRDPDADP